MSWINKFLNVNKYSRPATKLQAVRKIVVHYTANNGGTANGHFNYFNNLRGRYASAHMFVDRLMALCIIPLDEVAYHANDVQRRDSRGNAIRGVKELLPNANMLSIGVEMCLEKDGTIHPVTIARTEDVVAELCKKFNLDPLNDVVRHFDVTRKNCPAPWVSNGSLFTAFKKRVDTKVNKPQVAIGSVVITTKVLNIRKSASLGAEVVGVAVKNSKFDVYEIRGNFLNIDNNKWISNPDGKYADYTPKSAVKAVSKPKPAPTKVIKEIIKEGVENNMKLELNTYQTKMVAELLQDAQKDGILHDSEWEDKVVAGTLTMSEAIFLCLVLDERRSKGL